MKAKTLNVSDFRKQCLALIDHLPAEGVIITKRGRAVAKLLPMEEAQQDNRHLFGALKGRLRIRGDIMSTGDRWNAES